MTPSKKQARIIFGWKPLILHPSGNSSDMRARYRSNLSAADRWGLRGSFDGGVEDVRGWGRFLDLAFFPWDMASIM
jgi:hypothetical protein